MSVKTTCDWCKKVKGCEEHEGQYVCEDCAVWRCSRCRALVQLGDYTCTECDGCGDCCVCEHEDEEESQ